MHKRKIKIWMLVIVACLIIAGLVAAALPKPESFYKGVEPIEKVSIKIRPTAAVILADETVEAAPAQIVLPQLEQKSEPENIQQKIQPKNQPVKSPCYENTIPIIKNGEIVGCGYIK